MILVLCPLLFNADSNEQVFFLLNPEKNLAHIRFVVFKKSHFISKKCRHEPKARLL